MKYQHVQTTVAAVIITLMIGGLASTICFAEPKSDALTSKTNAIASKTNSVELKTPAPAARKVAAKHQITGAELYSMHCNRCHPERYPTERTAAQWRTILLHMQVRVNLPGKQARMILAYLQENSGR